MRRLTPGHVLAIGCSPGWSGFFWNRFRFVSDTGSFSGASSRVSPRLTTGFEIGNGFYACTRCSADADRRDEYGYRERPAGSQQIEHLQRRVSHSAHHRRVGQRGKTLAFFSVVSLVLVWISLALGVPVIVEFPHPGLGRGFPRLYWRLPSSSELFELSPAASSRYRESGPAETRRLAYLSFRSASVR